MDPIYVLQSSRISRKLGALIVRYSQEREWTSIVWEPFNCSELWNLLSSSDGVCSKIPLQMNTSIKNCKCHTFNFRMISLDRIPYFQHKSQWSICNTHNCTHAQLANTKPEYSLTQNKNAESLDLIFLYEHLLIDVRTKWCLNQGMPF